MIEAFVVSCGRRIKSLVGKRYGRLEVTKFAGRTGKYPTPAWECRCDCGNVTVVKAASLRAGMTQSCGCFNKDMLRLTHTTHNQTNSSEYKTWDSMVQRCCNVSRDNYPRYGGRGITVCSAWKNSFEQFLKNMGPKPSPQHSLDRIDNNGNYEPANCRWATRSEQRRNMRTNRVITLDGVSMCLTDWSTQTGIPLSTLKARLRRGHSVKQALTTPIDQSKRNRAAVGVAK